VGTSDVIWKPFFEHFFGYFEKQDGSITTFYSLFGHVASRIPIVVDAGFVNSVIAKSLLCNVSDSEGSDEDPGDVWDGTVKHASVSLMSITCNHNMVKNSKNKPTHLH